MKRPLSRLTPAERKTNDRRLRFRFQTPARVKIEDRTYETADLAPTGMAIREWQDAPAPGRRFQCELELPGVARPLGLVCEVRHHDALRQVVGCVFVDLAPAAREALDALYASQIADLKPAGSLTGGAFAPDAHLPPAAAARRVRTERHTFAVLISVLALGALVLLLRSIREEWRPVIWPQHWSAQTDEAETVPVMKPLAAGSNTAPATVTVTAGAGAKLAEDFVGLSFEVRPIMQPALTKGNLTQYLKTLGPSILRFGANQADKAFWTSSGEEAPAWAEMVLTPDDLGRLNSLAEASGWKVILGVNLKHKDAARAADEAASARRILGEALVAIEVGNEPNYYPDYTPAQYYADFESYREAIAKAAPGVGLIGPSGGSAPSAIPFLTEFARLQENNPHHNLEALSAHFYPDWADSVPAPTMADLLSLKFKDRIKTRVQLLVDSAKPLGVQTRLTEANSLSASGLEGVSDRYGSALWAVDQALLVASLGVTGENFHANIALCGGPKPRSAAYTPFCAANPWDQRDGKLIAQPEYYALLMLREIGTGTFAPVESSDPETLRVYALRNGTRLSVVLDNLQDPASHGARQVTLELDGPYSQGELLRLSGPALEARTGITLGGSSVDEDGNFPPVTRTPLEVSGSTLTLSLPPASVTLVTLTPGTQPAASAQEPAPLLQSNDDELENLLRSAPAGGVVQLEARVYRLSRPLVIARDNVTICGAGRGKTILEGSFPGQGEALVSIRGEIPGEVQGKLRGSLEGAVGEQERILRLAEPIAARPGDFVYIRVPNDAEFLQRLGSQVWNRQYPYLRQTLAKVDEIRGNELVLVRPAGMAFPAHAEIAPIVLRRGVVVRDLTIRYALDGTPADGLYENSRPQNLVDGIAVIGAAGVEIRNIEVLSAGRHSLSLDDVYEPRIADVDLVGSWNKGAGGNGYLRIAGTCFGLFDGIRLRGLRHLAFQWSSHDNTVARLDADCDVNFHGGYCLRNRVQVDRLEPRPNHPWHRVSRTEPMAHWAPPDGEGNVVVDATGLEITDQNEEN